jgi:hypothetical protein
VPAVGLDVSRLSCTLAAAAAHWRGLLLFSVLSAASVSRAEDSSTSAADAVGWGVESNSAAAPPTPSAPGADAIGWGEATPLESSESTAAPAGPSDQATAPKDDSKLQIQGRLRVRVGAWTRQQGESALAQARTALDLSTRYSDRGRVGGVSASWRIVAGVHAEYDAAYLVDPERYDRATIDVYQEQVYLRETLIAASLGPVTLTVGRQLFPLGQAEVLGLLDLVGPRDLREAGLTDLEDLRLPILSSRLALSLGRFNLEGVVCHEANFGLFPSPLAMLSPFRKLLLGNPLAGELLGTKDIYLAHVPHGVQPDRWQYFGRASFAGTGVDLDLYVGSVFDRLGVTQSPSAAELSRDELTLKLFHPRYTFVGAAGSWAVGNVLFRYELIGELERPVATIEGNAELLQFGMQRHNIVGALVGLTYFGPHGFNGGLEVQKSTIAERRVPAAVPAMLWPIESISGALRITQDLARQRLRINLLAGVVGLEAFNGAFGRAELSYTVTDDVRIDVGYVVYFASPEFGPFYGFEHNDRAMLTLRWDFSAR